MSTANATPAELAVAIRAHALRMVHRANASHIGTCLSIADILAVLYGSVLRVDPQRPDWPERDRFILSKGHGAAIFYAVLAERGFFPVAWLEEEYCRDGGRLCGHATSTGVPGVEVSTGSLGHGLSIGCGMALAAKRGGSPARVFVVLSDGELDEGSTWEAVLFAAHHGLDNLVAIVDYNKIQSFGRVAEVLDLDPLADKWRAFRWGVREIDGHDQGVIAAALGAAPLETGRPSVLVAHTVKGKGVSFMENDLAWHYRSPDAEQLARALAEIGAGS
ncbi:MAG TPA: transketolase [Candidatus Binatia bacterium]|nr:transketolase [Candidatus Binatia bacterium]